MRLPFFNKKKNSKGLIGVDFQPDRIAIAHIRHADKAGDKPILKQCAFEPLSPDAVEQHQLITDALGKVSSSFPVSQYYCNSTTGNNEYELLLIDAPSVESSELRQAVRWRIKDQLAYHIDDAVVDVFEIPGQQSTRAKLMYVVAAQRQDIQRRVTCLKHAGLDIQFMDIYELAQRNIAAIVPEDQDGLVLMRFNEHDGLLTITRNGTLYLTRKIDFGYERLQQVINASSRETEDDIELFIDEVENIGDHPDHEAFDEGHGEQASTSRAELNELSKSIVDEVILEIQRSLDYYVSHFNQRAVSKIIFAPVVNEVPGVIEYVSDMLGIKTEILDFNQYLDVAKPLNKELQASCFEAIGLALRQEVIQGQAG